MKKSLYHCKDIFSCLVQMIDCQLEAFMQVLHNTFFLRELIYSLQSSELLCHVKFNLKSSTNTNSGNSAESH